MKVQRGSNGIMHSFFNIGARLGGSLKQRPVRFTATNAPIPIRKGARWAPEAVWTGAENLGPPGGTIPGPNCYTNCAVPAHS